MPSRQLLLLAIWLLGTPVFSAPFIWAGQEFATQPLAEAAMRSTTNNVAAPFLELRRTTVTAEGRLLAYRVRPRPAPRMYSNYLTVYSDSTCGRDSMIEVLDCLRNSWSPPRDFLLANCTSYMPSSNIKNDWCEVHSENGDFYEAISGQVAPDCITQPFRNWAIVCAEGWDETCTAASTPADKTTLCTVDYLLRTSEILEKLGYRLSINEMVEQTPSPKAVAKADRTVPLEITLVRPTALAAESQPITFDLKVTVDSAGINDAQASGGAPRPQGWLLPSACTATTQRPGTEKDRAQLKRTVDFQVNEASVTVSACLVLSEYSGEYTLEGKCDNLPDCIKTEARRQFNVKVGGLTDMTTLTDALNVVYIGETAFTPSSHWLTPVNIATFRRIAACWNAVRRPRPNRPGEFFDPLLHVNDASLTWGGKFSINGSWSQTAHVAHRLGSSLDIRANNQAGAIPAAMRDAFRLCVSNEGVAADFEQPPRVRPGQEHFHLDF